MTTVTINKNLSNGRIKLDIVSRELSIVDRGRNYGEPPIFYSATEPANPTNGLRWCDTSSEPYIEYRYLNGSWVTIGQSSAGGGHTIQDNGTSKTQRTKLNFIGFTVADDSVNDATKVTAIPTDISGKVDKVTGKGLSTNDYTTAEKQKLAGIQEGAEVNVNSDWNASGTVAEILNKPTIPAAQIQSDWNRADSGSLDYIKNKPALNFDPAGSANTAESNAKSYADSLVTKVWKDQGTFSAAPGSYPTAADTTNPVSASVLGGMLWTISTPGTINGVELNQGDNIRAIIDNPGNNWTDWAAVEGNLGYTPENEDNKVSSFQMTPDDTHYPTEKLLKDSLDNKQDTLDVPTAANDVLMGVDLGGSVFGWVKKTLAELKTALRLGNAAYKDTGTTAGTVCAGDDARLSDNRTDADAFHKGTANEIEALDDIGTGIEVGDPILVEDRSDATPFKKKKLYIGNLFIAITNYLGVFKLAVSTTGDWTTTSNDVGNDATKITGMTASLAAGTTYIIRGSIRCAGPAAGLKLAISHSSAASIFVGVIRGTAAFTNDSIAAVDTLTGAFYLNTNGQTYFSGTITTTNAADIFFRAAAATAGQTITVYKDGTYMIIEKRY